MASLSLTTRGPTAGRANHISASNRDGWCSHSPLPDMPYPSTARFGRSATAEPGSFLFEAVFEYYATAMASASGAGNVAAEPRTVAVAFPNGELSFHRLDTR
jgi:hypothetical protein